MGKGTKKIHNGKLKEQGWEWYTRKKDPGFTRVSFPTELRFKEFQKKTAEIFTFIRMIDEELITHGNPPVMRYFMLADLVAAQFEMPHYEAKEFVVDYVLEC